MTDSDLTPHFRAHVLKLEAIATSDADEDRRLDAARTLAVFCLLLDGWRPGGGGDGGGEVVDLAQWREESLLRAA